MFDAYEKLTGPQKNTFSDVANKLLANTFLARDKDSNKNDYYFVVSYKEIFDEFFSIINYELTIDTNAGAIMLTGDNNYSVVKLKKDETIILLVLRILYHEKMKETSLNENIIISLDDIHEKYNYLELKKRINKTDLISSLRTFRRFNVIDVLGDIKQPNVRIIVMPTILYAIKTEDINEVYQSVKELIEEVGDDND